VLRLHFDAQRWLVARLLDELGADGLGDLHRLFLGSSLGDDVADDGQDALEIYRTQEISKARFNTRRRDGGGVS
jgi:hypothetical protein